MLLPKLTVVLGGAASGKSAFAEAFVLKTKLQPVYLATAQILDAEMDQKVANHRAMRGDQWTTIEEPVAVAQVLHDLQPDQIVLLDCATLWLTNVVLADLDLAEEMASLLPAIHSCRAPVVIVSNEVGQGIVPDNPLSRQFRNAQGRLNQALASEADLVVAVMAGLPLTLKGQLP